MSCALQKGKYKNQGIAAKCILLQSRRGFRKIVQNEQIGPEVVHKYVERSDKIYA